MTTFFISDLHLCASRPAITRLFIAFLQHRLQSGDRLYILGDLFEAWIGDDAIDEEEQVITSMQQLRANNIALKVMHGNRDFLLGNVFAEAAGCQLIKDPLLIDLDGSKVLLMHGDTLCTDDLDYQTFRHKIRSAEFRHQFLNDPIEKRRAIAAQLREQSRTRSMEKSAEIMDVNQETVEAVMRKHHVDHLIHGHTHRPAQHRFKLDGSTARRTVLGDWYQQGSILQYKNGTFILESLPL